MRANDNGTGAAALVRRERLVDRLGAARVSLVEAGAGYGKSVLASQYRQALGVATATVPLGEPDAAPGLFVASIRRALAGARLSDLLAATDTAAPEAWVDRLLDALAAREDPVLLILDDAHHLAGPESAALVLRLVRGLAAPHRVLVAARSMTRALEPVWSLPEAVRLDTQSLAFSEDEARELMQRLAGGEVVTDHAVRLALESSGGWATALVLGLAAASAGQNGSGGAPDPVGRPLRGILAAMDPGDRAVATQLAHLPFVSVELCDRIAGRIGSFERIVASGIPLARTDTGWWELPSPVAQHLAAQAPLQARSAREAADVLWAGGEILAALRILLDHGESGAAAARLGALDPRRLDDLGFASVDDLVEALPEAALAEHPRILVSLARLAETAHQSERRGRLLARAERLVAAERDPELRREVQAEQARDLMWDGRTREAAGALAREVLAASGPDEITARARGLDVLGRLASWFSPTGPRPEAERLLLESGRLARRIGQRTWAAQALVALAGGFLFALCRFEEALDVLDDVLGELPVRHRYRAMVQTFRAEAFTELGRWGDAEAAIAEIRAVGAGCREPWVLAYACWQEAQLASYTGDAERCKRAVREGLDRHRDAWLDQPSGVEFMAQCADHLSRVAEPELAFALLARARERAAETAHLVSVHDAAVLARSGDPGEADAAIARALGPAAEPNERWPLLLLRAYAALRRGDPRAGALAAEAFALCEELGHPRGPWWRERAVTEALLATGPDRASSAVGGPDPSARAWRVEILGSFALRRGDGHPVELPAGRPARAVRILAAAGGRMHAETLIELLWPEAPRDVGRARLRNLRSRLRTAAGDVLVRDEEVIALAAGCEVDAEDFEREARAAISCGAAGEATRAASLARSALERYRGDLLPDDRYEEWAASRRERLRLLRLELLDLLAADAEHTGEIDEAARLLTRAIDAEPRDELRYCALARLLVSQGRTGSARGILEQARAALAAEGIPASPALERLADSLGEATGA